MHGALPGDQRKLRRTLRVVAVVLAGTALRTVPGRAQDATWQTNPGTNDFNIGANWTPATVPTGTAFFGTSTIANLSFSVDTTVGGWTFNAGASNYAFTSGHFLTFNGAGIVINGGSATITNNYDLTFDANSTAGGAIITNNNGLAFNNTSTAGSAIITNTFGGTIAFADASTAGSATITNNNGGEIDFNGSTLGSATINNSGLLNVGAGTAGNATITNTNILNFLGGSTAGSATIINNGSGLLNFANASTAGTATIINNSVNMVFDGGNAGSATIIDSGSILFEADSSAASATITSNGGAIHFFDNSTANSATFTLNNGHLEFSDTSTAGSATITTNSGGTTFLDGDASGGTARFIFSGTGLLNISGLTNGGTTAGSIEGNGNIFLGANNLAVGGNNLSTTFTGVMQGAGGSLTKVGTGTLTLSGINTYTGGTTVTGGLINFNSAGNFGSGNITLDGGGLQWAAGNTTDISGKLNAIGINGATFDYNGNAVTLATSLTGPGGVTVTNSGSGGVLTFTAANSYIGGTVVAGSTLQLLGSGTLGATTGTTTISGGTLNLGGTTQTQVAVNLAGGTLENGSLNAPVSSTGGIVNGIGGTASLTTTSGLTTVEGVNTYSGATTVNGGVLNVIGTISDPTVNGGGVLTGTGSVGATQINAGGTFAPGSGTPGTSMTIAGNLAFASGALYLVSLNPTTASFAKVAGTASLAGTVQANFASGSYISKQKQYTILTAAGGLSGATFGSLANFNLPSGASDTLSYDASHVYLNLTVPFTSYTGLNVNQQNVANALTNFFNTTGGIPAQFFGLAPGSLTQIDGEAATGAERAAFQLTNGFLTLMLNPFVNGRSNASGVPGGGALGFAPDERAALPPDIALAYASIPTKAPPQNVEQRWTAWGSAFGGGNRTNGDPAIGSNNTTANSYGFAGGMDYHFTPSTVAGFALAGAGTSWGLANALGTGRSDALQVGAYGISWFGPAYVAGALSFSNHWFTTGRSALGDQLSANFIGQGYGARLEGGYRIATLQTFAVTPYGAVQFQDFNTPAYSETDVNGGGFGLSYAAMNATDVRTELGARFDAPTVVYGKPLVLSGRVAWAHDFVSNPAQSAAFQSLPGAGFTVFGAPIPHNAALTTAGAQLHLTPQWTLIAKFDGEFADGSQTYGGSGTLRYAW